MTKQTGLSTPELLDRIIESERRRLIFDEADAAYAALQADPEAWDAELSERRLWDTTLADGLEMDTLYEPAAVPSSEREHS